MKSLANFQENLKLMLQEVGDQYQFSSPCFMTSSFMEEFGEAAATIALNALLKIKELRVQSAKGADYLQILKYKETKFWIIDDINHLIVLLPSDY